MKKHIALLFALTFVCKLVETKLPNERFIHIDRVLRCENDEVICYLFVDDTSGYGGRGGMSCKFKELKQDD